MSVSNGDSHLELAALARRCRRPRRHCHQQGVIPIIRSPRNSSAALIAENLDRRLREHLLHSPSLSTLQSQSFQRPVLVLLDRNVDLSVMLQHTWTYQAMVHDLLSFDLNRVSVWVRTRIVGSRMCES